MLKIIIVVGVVFFIFLIFIKIRKKGHSAFRITKRQAKNLEELATPATLKSAKAAAQKIKQKEIKKKLTLFYYQKKS